jgi:hypothetical protein
VALLAVLWVVAAAGTAVALALAVVRDGVATSHYRSEYTRARWRAEGCLAEFRARLERSLSNSTFSGVSAVNADPWIDPRREAPPACALTLAPPTDGPTDVNAAPDSALLALPGFDGEVVDAVLRSRTDGRRIENLDQLIGALPRDLRDRVAAYYAELVGRATFMPPAWVVTAHGVVVNQTMSVVRERWVRTGSRIMIVRRELP